MAEEWNSCLESHLRGMAQQQSSLWAVGRSGFHLSNLKERRKGRKNEGREGGRREKEKGREGRKTDKKGRGKKQRREKASKAMHFGSRHEPLCPALLLGLVV